MGWNDLLCTMGGLYKDTISLPCIIDCIRLYYGHGLQCGKGIA